MRRAVSAAHSYWPLCATLMLLACCCPLVDMEGEAGFRVGLSDRKPALDAVILCCARVRIEVAAGAQSLRAVPARHCHQRQHHDDLPTVRRLSALAAESSKTTFDEQTG